MSPAPPRSPAPVGEAAGALRRNRGGFSCRACLQDRGRRDAADYGLQARRCAVNRPSTTDEFARDGRSKGASDRTERTDQMTIADTRTRWLALYVLCLGSLMIVLDVTIVNVALPSMREDLGFTETSLAWVVNGYLLTYGGFLLLGGRLGDLFGHRRLFIAGISLFTVASLACGLATTQWFLVSARAVQGLGGAVASAVSLSLMMSLFTEPGERAKAMGVFGFVAAGGGSLGVLLGGVLTSSLDWHWIFLVNLPLGLCRLRNVAISNVVGVLWAAGMFAWFFLSALYLQLVLGYSPLRIGLAFLPANLIMAAFSLGLSAKLVMRFGVRPPIGAGLG